MSSDFAVSAVYPRASNRLDVLTAVAGDAVDAADPTDCLSPLCWTLSAGGLGVVRVESLEPELDNTEQWRLYLDGDLPAAPCTIALAPQARSRYGQPTNTTPLTFSGLATLPLVDATVGAQGADLASPMASDATGDFSMLGRVDAVRSRVDLLVESTAGQFKHAPSFGRTIEAKRTYTDAKIAAEARALKSKILEDRSVKSASVSYVRHSGFVQFDVTVVTKAGDTIETGGPITSGGEP